MEYHGIVLGGNYTLYGGRNIAGFRLRTAAKKHGYDILSLDSSVVMLQHELLELLDSVITEKTLMLGISTVWLNGYGKPIDWIRDSFFETVKNKFPNLSIVAGGPSGNWVKGAYTIYQNSDWIMSGFSDIAFPKFLDLLSGKTDHGLIYHKTLDGKKTVFSDSSHAVLNPDDIETVLEEGDGFLPHQPVPLEVSRGCIFRCSFCNHPFQGAKDYDSYIRTPDSLARELQRNYELFGTTKYILMDDTFNDSIEKLDRLKRGIEKSKIPSFQFMSYIKPELLVTKPEMIPMLKDLGIKSGFVGIESLQKSARKAVKKGMDINRVLDAIAELNSTAGSSMHGSFIVGLPYDTKEDMFNTYEFLKSTKNQYFKSWVFHNMSFFYDRNMQGFSEMDNNPEKFGYTLTTKKADAFADWESPWMTSKQAWDISAFLNKDSQNYMSIAGWYVPLAWHVGLTDNEINTMTLKDFNPFVRGVAANRIHAQGILKKFKSL